jgi:hypothetical protein
MQASYAATLDREYEILSVAKETYYRSGLLSSRDIDAEFVFRFDAGWCSRVEGIRTRLKQLAGLQTSEDSPAYLADDLLEHLDTNRAAVLRTDDHPAVFSSVEGGYRPLDRRMQRRQTGGAESGTVGGWSSVRTSTIELEEEARLTSLIWSEINEMAREYQILPSREDPNRRIPDYAIEVQAKDLLDYVVRGTPIPSFVLPKIGYVETRMEHGIQRILKPHAADAVGSQLRNPTHFQLRPATRVRTWTVYFLTRRGSGIKTENTAVEAWNSLFRDTLEARNYRRDRYRLFATSDRIRVVS